MQEVVSSSGITSAGITVVEMNQSTPEIILIIVQIIFFIITGLIAIFTYLSARKTILQPIKTEVFKQQLIVFSEIMELFNGKKELEIREYFQIEDVLLTNAMYFVNLYAKLFFGLNSDATVKKYKDCTNNIIEKGFEDYYFFDKNDPEKELFENEEKSKEERWNNLNIGMVVMTEDWRAAIIKIEKLISSPLLPKKVIELLNEILKINMDNVMLVREYLNDLIKELPERYTEIEDLKNIEGFIWIYNEFNRRIYHYEDKVNELLEYTRKYLKVDVLLD